jgi:hypothetical protein
MKTSLLLALLLTTPATPGTHQITDYRVWVNATMNGTENSRMQVVLQKATDTWKILTLTGTCYETGKFLKVR